MVVKAKAGKINFSSLSKAFLFGSALAISPLMVKAQTFNTGDWRSASNGTLATSGIWEQYNGASWVAATGTPALASAPTVYVRHNISTSGSTGASSVIIESGAFTIENAFLVSQNLQVKQNTTLTINNALSFAASANFKADAEAKVIVNHAYTNPAATLWAGIENFAAGSTFTFKNWGANTPIVPNNTAITTTTSNSYTALFGNITFDLALANNTNLVVLASGVTTNLAHGNLDLQSSSATTTINLAPTGPATSGVKGNFNLAPAFSGAVNLAGSGTQTFSIGGNYLQQAGAVNFATSTSSSATATSKIGGSMQILGGMANLHAGSGSGSSVVQLSGNLTISNTAQLLNSNASGAAGASSPVSFSFAGFTPQTISVEPELTNIPFRIAAGATAKLARNIKVDGSAMFTVVLNGGTLDFNGYTYSGTSTFRQDLGATLRITSPDGISETGATGNVQSSVRAFNSGGIYHYAGTSAQITGTGLNTASGAKTIIIDNPTTVTLTRSVNISNSTSAGVDIRKGTFEGKADAFVVMPVTNSCFLKMAENTVYKCLAPANAMGTNQVFPQANGTYTLHASSTLELVAEGPQKLRGTTKVFGNITFGGSGIKTLSGNVANIGGTLTIKQTAIVDTEANTLGKTITNLSMTDGRLRLARTGTSVQPAMGGVYNLSGGVVEFYGSTAATSQAIRGGKEYYAIEITAAEANTVASNVSLATGSVAVKNEFRIVAPAVFQIGGGSAYITGEGVFRMDAGSSLKYGNANGITLQSCGTDAACGNIRTATRQFPADASYGFVGTTVMSTGNGLPTTVQNIYLQKGAATQIVTLSQNLEVTGIAAIEKGIFNLNNQQLTLSGSLVMDISGTFRGSPASELAISGAGDLGPLYFTPDYQHVGSLVLDRANGVVTLGSPLTVYSLVSFINGKLKTETGSELIFADGATYSGIAQADEAPVSYVVGPAGKVGNDAFIFPIGAETYYAPVAISAPADITDTFTAQYYAANPKTALSNVAEPELGNLSETEYWKIDHTGNSKVKISLGWSAARSTTETGTLAANARVAYLDNTAEPNLWRAGGYTETSQSGQPANFISSAEMQRYGYFTFGYVYAPEQVVLPVEWLYFEGDNKDNAVQLSWATASESDNAYFTIERSADGLTFFPLGKVNSQGNGNSRTTYTFTDQAPLAVAAYYRLRQTDLNGTESLSQTIRVKPASQISTFTVFPNPASEQIWINIQNEQTAGDIIEISIFDAAGTEKKHISGQNTRAGKIQIPISELPAGAYFIKIAGGSEAKTLPFIKH